MSVEQTEKIEYTIACVNEFAQKFDMSSSEAFSYLDQYKGVDYLLDKYEVVLSQPLALTMDDLCSICRRHGGLAA